MSIIHIENEVRLTNKWSPEETITVPEFVHLFRREIFDEREREWRSVCRKFKPADPILTEDEFKADIERFYKDWFHAEYPGTKHIEVTFRFHDIWWKVRRWYGHDIWDSDVAYNVIHNRMGGMHKFLAEIENGIVQSDADSYIDLKFFQYLPARFSELRQQLVEELLTRYDIKLLFPGNPETELVMARAILTTELRETLKKFLLHLLQIERLWQR